MSPARSLILGGLLTAALVALLSPALVEACGLASRLGKRVVIADEEAIIIWDDKTSTEHFIRRATFNTDEPDFGFLVPTPTQPELGEASDMAFKRLAIFAVPEPPGAKKGFGGKGGGKAKPPDVEVLDEKRVAGQDVVVLKASDADALAKWLTDHGYEFAPALKNWVKPYIDARWIITASKIARDRDGKALKNISAAAVRMSFKTHNPFYPYRELVEDQDKKATQPSRLLRVYFISNGAFKGNLGEVGRGRPWHADVVRVANIPDKLHAVLLRDLKLPPETGPLLRSVTVFEDRSSVRPGNDDVYFVPLNERL
jgi:hypothetical protein